MIKLNTKIFIERAKHIHGDKYDYSKVNYINSQTKVCITCPEHGEFWQTPSNHLAGKGCAKCGNIKVSNIKRKNMDFFINKAKKIHGNKYNYSKVEYNNGSTKICIICPKHGEFYQKPFTHLSGCGCPKCAKNGVKLTQSDFLIKAKEIHNNKYDYSKVVYKNSRSKICIICNEKDEFGDKHGEFWQIPNAHLAGSGCIKCAKKIVTKKDFYLRSNKMHENKYDYSKSEYKNSRTKVCIICPEHGEFWQMPYKHMSGQGCPKCIESKLESRVKKILEKYNIKYIQEKKFEWLRLNQPLRLDFYLPEYNIAIECQGKQHFFENCNFGKGWDALELTQLRDKTKYQLCTEHGIPILYYSTEKVNDNKIIKNEKVLVNEILKYRIKQ